MSRDVTHPAFITRAAALVDSALRRRLTLAGEDPGRLHEAMAYAVLGGGKRLRPAAVLAGAECVGGSWDTALPAACAVELLHAYTLVHDDLPCMDDDDVRRGRPTVHVAFGEATALLAGDGLLTLAFGTLAELGAHAGAAVRVLATRAGHGELLRGQARDLASPRQADALLADVELLHAEKTGALFAAATELGGIAAGATREQADRLNEIGMCLGIAFQHADDLDDGDFPALASVARERIAHFSTRALDACESFGAASAHLRELVAWVRLGAIGI